MLSIEKAKYTGRYNIHLVFNNAKEATVDLEDTIFEDNRAIFSKLKKESNFKEFKLDHSTIVWSDELDLAPEYLFYIAFKNDIGLQGQFKEWGYIT